MKTGQKTDPEIENLCYRNWQRIRTWSDLSEKARRCLVRSRLVYKMGGFTMKEKKKLARLVAYVNKANSLVEKKKENKK